MLFSPRDLVPLGELRMILLPAGCEEDRFSSCMIETARPGSGCDVVMCEALLFTFGCCARSSTGLLRMGLATEGTSPVPLVTSLSSWIPAGAPYD